MSASNKIVSSSVAAPSFNAATPTKAATPIDAPTPNNAASVAPFEAAPVAPLVPTATPPPTAALANSAATAFLKSTEATPTATMAAPTAALGPAGAVAPLHDMLGATPVLATNTTAAAPPQLLRRLSVGAGIDPVTSQFRRVFNLYAQRGLGKRQHDGSPMLDMGLLRECLERYLDLLRINDDWLMIGTYHLGCHNAGGNGQDVRRLLTELLTDRPIYVYELPTPPAQPNAPDNPFGSPTSSVLVCARRFPYPPRIPPSSCSSLW
eukprot:CAMPEP_0196653884 /NCGR_PEP_ID=MMETSP1086-20130531/3552_1 /TAXON_ID=77921 /ORGANISM="Cyanoptyche  gloeocystis , Strain SAG4.97" /LENGTH=264 /DNA_ID=CAMNT_0041985315 /DNA_START=168 /DNA_END=960 /DNA_ORIENTATION=-